MMTNGARGVADNQRAAGKKRIAILGGGIAGLTVAYELSATPAFREKYEIVVYQMGWRLGGKCATGRNAQRFNRIEEHGIHGFTGAYFNALPLMKAVYDAWGALPPEALGPDEDHPFPTFERAFPPKNSSFFWEMHDGKLKQWRLHRPPNDRTPDDAAKFGTLASWLAEIREAFLSRERQAPPAMTAVDPDNELDVFLESVARNLTGGYGEAAEAAEPATGLTGLDQRGEAEGRIRWDRLSELINAPKRSATPGETDAARRARITKSFLSCVLRGIRDDNIENRGFRSVDDYNFEDWLRRHGADDEIIASPLAAAPINTTYQYPDGDIAQAPRMSAASYLQWLLRGFAALGHAFYLFEAGSGETVVTPIYAVLKNRGVKFAFFHRVDSIRARNGSVSEIVMSRQAQLKRGEYDPLIDAGGLRAWPNEPRYEQLVDGDSLRGVDLENPYTIFPDPESRVILRNKADFDDVVIALPPAALKMVAEPLAAASPRWRRMLDGMQSIATQSMQLWLSKDLADLGWTDRDPNGEPWYFLAGNFRGGPHGHADFSKFLRYEDWPPGEAPKTVLYFSGILTDAPGPEGGPQRDRAADDYRAKQEGLGLLRMSGAQLLPKAGLKLAAPTASQFSFDFQLLVQSGGSGARHGQDQADPIGSARFDSQYWRSNALPSERYTVSPPGTKSLRLDPRDTGFVNATVAGDWVDFGLNVGSFEGACMAGKLAATALEPGLSARRIVGLAPTSGDGG